MTTAMALGFSSILFLWAVIIGIMLAFARYGKGRNPPPVLVWWHGAFAIVGFLILLYGSFFVGGYPLLANIGVFLIAMAAAFGLWMYFKFHRNEQLIPIGIVWAHGTVAATGFVLILVSMLTLADTAQV